jgi:hypothetical protein
MYLDFLGGIYSSEALEKGKRWSEVERMARDRTRWRRFVDALCPIRDNRR